MEPLVESETGVQSGRREERVSKAAGLPEFGFFDRSGSGQRTAPHAHRADRLELVPLVALIEQLDLLEFVERLAEGHLRVFELNAQFVG